MTPCCGEHRCEAPRGLLVPEIGAARGSIPKMWSSQGEDKGGAELELASQPDASLFGPGPAEQQGQLSVYLHFTWTCTYKLDLRLASRRATTMKTRVMPARTANGPAIEASMSPSVVWAVLYQKTGYTVKFE